MINESLMKNEELAVFRLRELYSGFGYSQFKMNKFEEYDLYVKNKDFLISDRIITFTDTNGKLLALKPDVTLSIINNFTDGSEKIQKMYYSENVYRVSGTNGRFKEIMQTGLECIGHIGTYEIAEVVFLAVKSLEIIDEDFSLELSHRALLSSLISHMGIDGKIKGKVLEAIGIKSSGMCDEMLSAELITKEQYSLIKALCANYSTSSDFINAISPFVSSEDTKKYFDEFVSLLTAVENEDKKGRLTVNFSIASNQGYYSGTVFKGYINGIPVSVLSGGQYDTLMKKFGEAAGAVGFAVYLDSFESFKKTRNEYDVDTVLLIEENAEPSKVFSFVEAIKLEGERIYVSSKLPEELKYRRILRMEG